MANEQYLMDKSALETAEEVKRPPITTIPPSQSFDPYSGGVLPGNLGLQTDVAAAQLPGSIPTFRLMPVPPGSAGSAQSNAGAQSNLLKNPAFVQNQQQTAANANAISKLQQQSFQGAWSASVNYPLSALVDFSGTLYVSTQNNNLGNEPDISPSFWTATGNSSVFLGSWNNVTAYVVGDQVIDVAGGGGYYIAVAGNTNKQPSANPTFWQLITAGNLNSYEGNYSGVTAYTTGELVSFQGALWVAIAGSTGQTPSLTSSFWSLLGSNSLFTGPWSSSTPYPQNSFVSQSGNIYQALSANANVNPVGNPGTWQLSGPATLDNLVDGSAFQKVLASMVNLVPDSDFTAPTIYWPGVGGTIQYEAAYPAAPFCPTFFFGPGTGAPTSFQFQYSKEIAVIPGATYTLSGFIDANSVTSGTPTWNIFDPTVSTNYAQVGQTAGHAGRVSVTFTVPGGVTRVVCLLDTSNCTLAAGQFIFWFQPQLVSGSNAGAYISSSQDYLSGTVLINFANTDHTNKNLNSIPDGTSTFGQTASGLSYRPLSNPLTGHDAGASATINIAAFTMRTSSKGDISINSGSITGLSYGTGYYIYYDDPTLAGGSVTFNATTTKGTALQGAGRFFVGSITTPASGAMDTIGNNDGGTGAQSGASLSILSNIQTPTLGGGYGNITPISGLSAISNAGAVTEQWSGYVPQSQAPPSAITLTVTSQVVITGAGTGNTILSYSTDGGSTFTTIYNTSVNRALTTDVINITLPATPQKIVLQAQNSHTAGSGTCTSTISNILLTVQI